MQRGLTGQDPHPLTPSPDRLSAWLILLPLYLLFMIPWTLCLILYRQVHSSYMFITLLLEI